MLMPQGRLCVAVWDSVETSPGYASMIELLDRLFGAEVADALRAPFVLGNKVALSQLFADAGINGASIVTRQGEARFPSIADWVRTDVKGWTLADMIDDEQYAALLKAAQEQLQHFAQPDGSVRFAAPGHIVTAVI